MSAFIPEDYEPVEERIRKFYADHPQGRIITDCISLDGDQATFRASVYRDIDPDPYPAATGHAHGLLTRPKALEMVETVSIGRALANLAYSKVGARPSREEMQDAALDPGTRHDVGNARGPKARERASTPLTERQLALSKRLLGEVADAVNIVTDHLGEYRPPELWTKYEASGDHGQKNGLIDKLIAAKETQLGGKQPTRSKGKDDSEWVEVPF